MSKRKVTPNGTYTVERHTGDSKRPRINDTPEPSQTDVQNNSLFFTRLSRDIRNIIYSYLTLPPLCNANTINTAGLIQAAAKPSKKPQPKAISKPGS
jgi:hypothetical protein